MKLSEHFQLSEFVKSHTAIRLHIDNSPTETAIKNLANICEKILEPLRAHYGQPIHINSGYRCYSLNKAVGGSATSQHTKGEAVDLEIPGVSNQELYDYLKDNYVFDQLILEFHKPEVPNSGWIHVSLRADGNNRQQSLGIK
jgi:hypothetical protein